MEVQQGNRNCNHSLKREKPARCAGIPLEPLNECCLAVKRMPLVPCGGVPVQVNTDCVRQFSTAQFCKSSDRILDSGNLFAGKSLPAKGC